MLVLGLLGAIAAAVLVIVLEDGTAVSAAVGIAACALIGLGEPGQMGAGLSFVTSSVLVVLSAVVIEAVALVAIVGFLVAAAGRVRALQVGVAAAGAVGALLLVIAPLVPMPFGGLLISVLIALAIGSIVAGVLEALRARREPSAVPEDA